MTVNEEVAKILIERVVKRLLLMAEITHIEVTVHENGVDMLSHEWDHEIELVACDTVELVRALAEYLETGTMPRHDSELSDPELAGRLLQRAVPNMTGMNGIELLAKELAGEWDSQPPAEGNA